MSFHFDNVVFIFLIHSKDNIIIPGVRAFSNHVSAIYKLKKMDRKKYYKNITDIITHI
jgi:hypothetical protein